MIAHASAKGGGDDWAKINMISATRFPLFGIA
jgi:hypothetical protein